MLVPANHANNMNLIYLPTSIILPKQRMFKMSFQPAEFANTNVYH